MLFSVGKMAFSLTIYTTPYTVYDMSMLTNDEIIGRAVVLAIKSHKGQVRRDSKEPYIVHPMRVANILINEFNVKEPESIALAFVHDVYEDGGVTKQELIDHLGSQVAAGVLQLSKNWDVFQHNGEFQEDFYWQVLEDSPYWVRIVKIADRLDNIRDYDRMILATIDGRPYDRKQDKRLKYMENTREYVLPMAKRTDRAGYDKIKEIVDKYLIGENI